MDVLDRFPRCDCGAKHWLGGGGQFSPGGSFTNNRCGTCGRIAMTACREGWSLLFIADGSEDPEKPSAQLSAVVDYINGTMAIAARAYEAEWRAVRDTVDKAAYHKVVRDFGLNPADGITTRWVEGANYESTHKYDAVNAKGEVMPVDGDEFIEAVRALPDPQRPMDLVPPPTPPQLPEGITVYMWTHPPKKEFDKVAPEAGYRLVDPKVSARAFMPPDPLRVAQDAYWARVFGDVRMHINSRVLCGGDHVPIKPVEIPNQYYEDRNKAEPWYTFYVNGVKFEVGHRKRVNSIRAVSPTSMDIEDIEAAAVADGVTFDKGYGGTATASKVLIHAETEKKTVEYLTILIKAALSRFPEV